MVRDNYITIQGWMVTDLGLKGNELLAYAIIYGFSQDGVNEFRGSAQYIADWLNVSKRTAFNTLNALVDRGLLIRNENRINNIMFVYYRVAMGSEKSSPVVKNLHGGSEKFSPYNIDNNNKENTNSLSNNNKLLLSNSFVKEDGKNKRFSKPTIDDISKYCVERKNNIDANAFYDFYEARGWMVGKSHMKDWKAAVRTWEARRKQTGNASAIKSNQRVYIDHDRDFYFDEDGVMQERKH